MTWIKWGAAPETELSKLQKELAQCEMIMKTLNNDYKKVYDELVDTKKRLDATKPEEGSLLNRLMRLEKISSWHNDRLGAQACQIENCEKEIQVVKKKLEVTKKKSKHPKPWYPGKPGRKPRTPTLEVHPRSPTPTSSTTHALRTAHVTSPELFSHAAKTNVIVRKPRTPTPVEVNKTKPKKNMTPLVSPSISLLRANLPSWQEKFETLSRERDEQTKTMRKEIERIEG